MKNNKMVLGILVTYNPIFLDLEKNINAILPQLDKLVIFDNNSDNKNILIDLCLKLRIELILNPINIGLGSAYNRVIKDNLQNYGYFITFDQDTLIQERSINKLLNLFSINRDIGIVGPSFNKRHLKRRHDYTFVDTIIQSSALFSKECFLKSNFFHEKLFIDSVDFEYCLRVRLAGLKILQSNRVWIDHNIGNINRKYGFSYIEHSSLRNYYIGRNHKYLTMKYLTRFPYFILKKNIFFFLHVSKLLFLDQEINKVRSIFRGLKENI
jgi:rhamnosyltransferase